MSHSAAVTLHIVIGSLAIGLYWLALLARKGSARHRAAGRPFFITLGAVALSVGPLLLLRPGPFDPAYVVQFTYLALCLFTVSAIGWTAIRWKDDVQRFRGLHFRILGPVLLLLGAVVLAAGLAQRDPLPVVLSWVGLAYGAGMIRFAWMKAPLAPSWWLNWHLNATCGLFTAVHGTVLFVAWRWAVQPQAGHATAAVFHLGVLAAAVAMRLWFGRQRGVPLRFTREPAARAHAPEATLTS
jgi:uncharacterized membrane protein